MDDPEKLDDRQKETLKRLVCIPSPSGHEQLILEFIETRCKQFPGCTPRWQGTHNNKNLIVEKGEGKDFGLLLYVHVDTVPRKDGWENDYALEEDTEHGLFRGVGVYDMKSQVMVALDVLERAVIPKGVTLIVVFGSAEESNSAGVRALVDEKREELRSRCQIILSSDISTYAGYEHETPKNVVIARRGNLKTAFSVTVLGGHAYNDEAPSAPDAAQEMKNHLNAMLAQAGKKDEYCGSEKIRIEDELSQSTGCASLTQIATWTSRQWLVPGSTVDGTFAWQKECAKRLAEIKKWKQLDIGCSLAKRDDIATEPVPVRSYEPFRTDPNDPMIRQIVLPSVDRIYGSHLLSGGLSTADTNELMKIGLPIAEVAPIGGDPHLGTEWVSESSVARLITFQHDLITRQIPEYLRQQK